MVVGFDFSRNKIILFIKPEDEKNLLRNEMKKKNLYVCKEIRENVFEVNPEDANSLNRLLSESDELRSLISVDASFEKWKQEGNAPKSPVLIRKGPVKSIIYPGNNKIPVVKIEEETRFFLKAAVNMQKYKEGKWDGYINLYDRRTRSFPSGLIERVTSLLEKEDIGYIVEVIYEEIPQKQYNWEVNDGLIPDPDQLEAVEAAIKGVSGIIKAPTGFGKICRSQETIWHGFL